MKLHADHQKRAVVDSNTIDWVPSPLPGVDRRMLDRDGEEVARATSVVRYAPDSYFSAHTHGGGEEFLVLEGVFSDETGDFAEGMYVRNPIGSRHTPHSKPGGTILVKLRQFEPADQAFVRIDTRTTDWQQTGQAGVKIMPLHHFGSEQVALLNLEAGSTFVEGANDGGNELFILAGSLSDPHGSYQVGTWIRNPPGSDTHITSDAGCKVFRKSGHLH